MFDHADEIAAALVPWLADHADEIAAAFVLCWAARYSVRAICAWRGALKVRREIEYLDLQGRQIFKLIVNDDKKPTVA